MQRREFIQGAGVLSALALAGVSRVRGDTAPLRPAKSAQTSTPSASAMIIHRNGSRPSAKGPSDWFTGTVGSTRCFRRPRPPASPARP